VNISDILRYKGHDVVTGAPIQSVSDLIATMAERNLGAVVVVDGGAVVGIASERDVVRQAAVRGASVLDAAVSSIMTSPVVTCASKDSVDAIAETMTERRIRHMPVVDDGALVGIVSIGDVVSSRIRQLEHDRGTLEQYISS
jgi:CBS domain-containing protein